MKRQERKGARGGGGGEGSPSVPFGFRSWLSSNVYSSRVTRAATIRHYALARALKHLPLPWNVILLPSNAEHTD